MDGTSADTATTRYLAASRVAEWAQALNARGLEANREGHSSTALRNFLAASVLLPSDPRFVLSAANMHLKIGDVSGGVALCERLIGLPLTPRQKEQALSTLVLRFMPFTEDGLQSGTELSLRIQAVHTQLTKQTPQSTTTISETKASPPSPDRPPLAALLGGSRANLQGGSDPNSPRAPQQLAGARGSTCLSMPQRLPVPQEPKSHAHEREGVGGGGAALPTYADGQPPSEASVLNAYGLEANRSGDTAGALRLFLAASALAPGDARYLLSAANMHVKRGNTEQGALVVGGSGLWRGAARARSCGVRWHHAARYGVACGGVGRRGRTPCSTRSPLWPVPRPTPPQLSSSELIPCYLTRAPRTLR
jgi:hypothetical protein